MTAAIHKVGMPKWGLSMTEGKLISWLVDEGEPVDVGTELLEIETEKIAGALESPAAGVLRRQVAGGGDVVPVGGLVGVIADAGVPDEDIDAFVADFQASFVPPETAQEAASPTETVEVGGRQLRYLRLGEGAPPVVFLHGFGGDLNNWLFNCEKLSADRAVYALDLPGHGESAKDVGAGDLAFFADTLGAFLDAIEIDAAHLVGHSMGGAVALGYALDQPARVVSLTLIDAAGLGKDINADYIDGFVGAVKRRDLKPVLELLFADSSLVSRQLVDDVLRYKRKDGVEDALRTIRDALFPDGRQAVDLSSQLEELPMPVLVIWGSADGIIPVAHAGVHIEADDRGRLADVSGEYAIALPGAAGWCLGCAHAFDPQVAAWELAAAEEQPVLDLGERDADGVAAAEGGDFLRVVAEPAHDLVRADGLHRRPHVLDAVAVAERRLDAERLSVAPLECRHELAPARLRLLGRRGDGGTVQPEPLVRRDHPQRVRGEPQHVERPRDGEVRLVAGVDPHPLEGRAAGRLGQPEDRLQVDVAADQARERLRPVHRGDARDAAEPFARRLDLTKAGNRPRRQSGTPSP